MKSDIPTEGIFAVYKEEGMTSHDVVDVVRRCTGQKRVGHAGTLDPCAKGVLVIGVGLGGSLDAACLASKTVFFRNLGTANRSRAYDRLEKRALRAVNALGIGPMGMGGRTTALAVHVAPLPCHIASMPVAVTLNCHSHRHALLAL